MNSDSLTIADTYQYSIFFFSIFLKLNLANLFLCFFLSGSVLGVDSSSYARVSAVRQAINNQRTNTVKEKRRIQCTRSECQSEGNPTKRAEIF